MIVNHKSYKLGSIIEPVRIRCDESNPEVVGVDVNHSFIPTRANLSGVDTSKYLVVPAGCFACNLMHIGRDERLPLAYNSTGRDLVITHAYYVFRVKTAMEALVMPNYLYLYLCRQETDRYTWFCTDSSIRGNLPEARLLDIEIPVPDIEIQRQLVNVWEGLNSMKQDNEAQAEPLMELCMSYLKKLKKEYPLEEIGRYIHRVDIRNTDNAIKRVMGLSVTKEFREPTAKVNRHELEKYKVLAPRQFGFVQTTNNEKCLVVCLSTFDEKIVISSVNEVFEIVDEKLLLPEYLHLWFLRKEMDRYARFHSWGSARETFNFEDMKRVRIPIPPIEIQRAIANIYSCAKESKAIAEQAEQLRRIAGPALMQKAINN